MQDYAVNDFSGGYMTNAAYHPGRDKSAQFCLDCRSQEQGWLVPRKGYMSISSESGISEVFVHKNILLVVIYGILKWTRISTPTEQVTFHDFHPDGYLIKTGSERVVFHAYEDAIYISTGKASFVVDVPVEPNVPSVRGFHLAKPTLAYSYVSVEPVQSPYSRVWIRAQFVVTDGSVDVTDSDPTDAIDRGTHFAQAVAFSEPSDARYVDIQDENDDNLTRTIIQMRVEGAPEGTVGYIDFFRTERGAGENDDYYFFMRVPYSANFNSILADDRNFSYDASIPRVTVEHYFSWEDATTYVILQESALDGIAITARRQMIGIESWTPNFQYIATNEYRTYVAEAGSDKVYISYYNPANNEAFRQNFVDVIPLQLEGGEITGLHFLRDTFLYVYTTNQIQVIATDPIGELHRVIDYIKPRNEKGEIVGCAAPDTIVNIVGRHYFLATNQRVYRFDGQRLYDMSDRVHGAFQKVLTPTDEGKLQLQDAIGYAVDEDYVVSVNMVIPGEAQSNKPNRLLVYDVTHRVWWHDSYGIEAVSKGVYDSVFGVINGQLYLLHHGNTDDGETIRRVWRGHPYQTTTQKTWESVHVHPLTPCRVDIKAYTEQAEHNGYVDIENIAVFNQKRMGCNLRGAVQTVEIQTDSDAVIHRIAVNEKPRNR